MKYLTLINNVLIFNAVQSRSRAVRNETDINHMTILSKCWFNCYQSATEEMRPFGYLFSSDDG